MKLKKLISTIFLASTLAVGVGVGVAALKQNKEAEPASAGSASSYAKIYRFTAPAEYWGGTVYVHAWGSATSSKDTTWPGIDISGEYSYNESSRKVYTFATNVTDYQYLIFHNNSGWQTDNITIGDNTAWYLDGGNTPGTWTPTNQTYYLYDYKNLFGGNAKCYAWQSNGSLNNADYPGVAMTKVQYGSGQLYSISLDPAFDMVKFGIGDSANTGDQWCNQHRGEAFCWWDAGDSSWSNDLDWVKAHDWIYQTMHVRDIPTTDNDDTGACRGSAGYYQKAKTAYQSFSAAIKTKISQDDCCGIAQARLSAWAKANGETATFSGTTLTINKNVSPISIINGSNDGVGNNIIIIVVISTIVVTVIGGYFFLRHRKEN